MNNLFRKVQKPNIPQNVRYEGFGFSQNPFPRHPGVIMNDPDKRQNGSIYMQELRAKEEKQFEQILIPKDSRSEAKTIAFLMDYATRKGRGIGKTAFLNYQKGRVMSDLGAELSENKEVLFAVYVAPVPSDNYRKFWSISKLIISAIIDQELLATAMCRLRVFSGMIDEEILLNLNTDLSLSDTIGNDKWLLTKYEELKKSDSNFNSKIDITALNQSVQRQLLKAGIDADFGARLARFGYSSSEIYKFYFDPLPDYYWKKEANDLLFGDFVKIFDLAGFTHGIILFEELEKVIIPLTSSGRREFCEALRYYFIDGVASYNTTKSFYKILLTIHPYLQELLYPHWNASGLGRFAGLSEETSNDYTIYFNPIDPQSAVPLAKAYIDQSRIVENQGLKPFTEDSLALALNKTLGVPGKYLAFLHSAIEKAIDENWSELGLSEIKALSIKDTPEDLNDQENDELGQTEVKLS